MKNLGRCFGCVYAECVINVNDMGRVEVIALISTEGELNKNHRNAYFQFRTTLQIHDSDALFISTDVSIAPLSRNISGRYLNEQG